MDVGAGDQGIMCPGGTVEPGFRLEQLQEAVLVFETEFPPCEFTKLSCSPNVCDAMRFGYASDETADPCWCKLEDLCFLCLNSKLAQKDP